MTGATAEILSWDARDGGGFAGFAAEWRQRMGDRFAMPSFEEMTKARFRARAHAFRLHDVVFNRVDSTTVIQTAGFAASTDFVRLWIVRRGGWHVGDGQRTEHTVAAGQFLMSHGPMSHFASAPATSTQLLTVPAEALDGGVVTMLGPARLPEVRVLTAHASTVLAHADDLSATGLQAARSTLIELARAVIHRRLDDVEPRLAPALAAAARRLADGWLTRPDLSPEVLARELNVSVRTLQRAFAAEDQSVTGYVRARRLAQARAALTAPTPSGGPARISDVAARWQFADASHFSREFKRCYGITPREHRQGATRARREPPASRS
ncbi:transcriptional regulator [Actinoplanes philippinensis]|uniref:AraC-type DNA-binding protein n=1 Tax=Actinoplanes philippinensis TaxID=35752 RepID=A0A1I2HHW3_9ACTN|nr:helix-turn-helix domain-containing protein [Actinoplanes philippinensis]GIE81799.1 transcriptional regulator [Actinoplanes philippinensis]SFF28890.1 AraC-type DNA-binding protein [Actinoplanes philippinensis]